MRDLVGTPNWQALEADLPRKRWSGKRLVATGVLFLLLVAVALSIYDRLPSAADDKLGPDFVALPTLTVALRSGDAMPRYLKLQVVLDAPTEADAAAARAQMPVIVDGFQTFLRELRPEDLAGTAGTFRIKEELLTRVNQSIAPRRVDDVLIQELIQQ